MKKKLTRAAAIAAAACLSTAGLSACSISSDDAGSIDSVSSGEKHSEHTSDKDKDKDAATDGEKDKGDDADIDTPEYDPAKYAGRGCTKDNVTNQEVPIVEDVDLGPISISAVYFQPGQMMQPSDMLDYDKAAAHLEVDTKMTEKGEQWGYSVEETPANMNIKYIIRDASDKVVLEGKLMEMNAGDGSHYGTNLPEGKMKDGKYTVQFIIAQPKNYALHKDLVTGVPADNWWDTIPTKKFDWDYKTPVKSKDPVSKCDTEAYQPVAKVHPSTNPEKKPIINDKADWSVPGKGKCSEVEINVGSADAAPFHIDVNYFQPGGMLDQWLGKKSMMNRYEDSDMHLEADIKMVNGPYDAPVGAVAWDYGYNQNETPANLNVEYSIIDKKTSKVVDHGKFMEMNADDGSHYGTNIKKNLMQPGKYELVLKISAPKDYSLHIDKKTGVAVRHWYKDFDVRLPWDYTGAQKACIVTPWQDAFPKHETPKKEGEGSGSTDFSSSKNGLSS